MSATAEIWDSDELTKIAAYGFYDEIEKLAAEGKLPIDVDDFVALVKAAGPIDFLRNAGRSVMNGARSVGGRLAYGVGMGGGGAPAGVPMKSMGQHLADFTRGGGERGVLGDAAAHLQQGGAQLTPHGAIPMMSPAQMAQEANPLAGMTQTVREGLGGRSRPSMKTVPGAPMPEALGQSGGSGGAVTQQMSAADMMSIPGKGRTHVPGYERSPDLAKTQSMPAVAAPGSAPYQRRADFAKTVMMPAMQEAPPARGPQTAVFGSQGSAVAGRLVRDPSPIQTPGRPTMPGMFMRRKNTNLGYDAPAQ